MVVALENKKRSKRFLVIILVSILGGLILGVSERFYEENSLAETSSEEIQNNEIAENDNDNDNNVILPWYLTLVNYENYLPANYIPERLTEVDNGYEADDRIASATKQMIADARKENVRIIALSAFRDYEYQKKLYEEKAQKLMKENNYSQDEAYKEAVKVVAYPGTSEHQLGLALDLVDARYTKLDESQENTKAYKWLYEHCHEYGFIVRYPNGKTDITGIIYEPWHFRYVGKDAAEFIMKEDITLEEYLNRYYSE